MNECLFSLHQIRAKEATTCFQIPTSLVHCSTAERPKYDMPKSVLEELRGIGFSWSKVARMFSVSRWTVYRRIEEYDLQRMERFADISDEEVDAIVRDYMSRHGEPYISSYVQVERNFHSEMKSAC